MPNDAPTVRSERKRELQHSKDPVRRLVRGIETFNVRRGGEYFFMPSISALKWLADSDE